jgi:hypothetical protein
MVLFEDLCETGSEMPLSPMLLLDREEEEKKTTSYVYKQASSFLVCMS